MSMINHKKSAAEPVRKPFLTGSPMDEHSFKSILLFFGSLIATFIFSFIVCASTGFSSIVLRLFINIVIIFAVLVIYFNSGTNNGAEAVARGEILYQKEQKGTPFTDTERRVSFHPLKGFMIGFLATLPFFITALIFALNARIQTTDSGTLPSWMQAYIRRSDIGAALVQYTQPEAMSVIDFLRMIIRVCLMPFVNIVGSSNRNGLIVLERLSPMIMLLPAASFGFGYLSGQSIRTRVHTAISENEKRRMKKEKRARRKRTERSHEPEKLN